MAGAGGWELVKGGKKGKTIANGKLNKDEKRQFLQNALVLTEAGRLEKVNLDRENKENKENHKPASPKNNNEQKKKKPVKKESSHQPGSLEEAVRKLSVSEMQNLLDVVMARFFDNPLIWLKDLASYLNVRINPKHQPDHTFSGRPVSYPVSLLSPNVKKLLMKTISKCSDSVLAAFHKHCITSMVHEQVKGLSVAGYKIFIQILSIHRPHIGVMNLPYYCEMRQNLQNQSQPAACLSLLWAIGQSGIDDFSIGLKVWMEFMVPIIGLKNYSTYVVDYGSHVFGGGGGSGTEDCSDVLGMREFFSLMDFTWCSSGSLPKAIQRQLFSLYPKVKTTAFSSTPEMTLRNFFPSFLRRLDANAPHLLRVELLTCLVQCLTQDLHCWAVWSQLYLKHLPQSALLLSHLCKEKKILQQALKSPSKEIWETLESFRAKNEKMSRRAHAVSGSREAEKATQALISQLKSKQQNSRRFSLTKVLVILLMSGIIWDISNAGSFQGSRLGKSLERLGLMPYCEAFGVAAKTTFIRVYKWCYINVPIFYTRGCELAGPYLILVWAKAEGVASYISTNCERVAESIPAIKDKMEVYMPGLREKVIHYGGVVAELGQTMMATAVEKAGPYVSQVHQFFMTRVLIGPLAPEAMYEYMVGAFNTSLDTLLRIHTNLVSVIEDSDTKSKTL